MILAAAYIRVSTDEQTDYSPAVQLEEIQEFARKNNYYIPPEFVFADEGISGRSAEKRPAFQAMIRQARKKTNHIQFIIVHKYDRFARSKDDAVLYKALLKKDGVKVISVKEPIPQDDKFAVIYESMLEAMAEYYSLNLSEEVKKTMKKKAELGEWQTTAPYGYRNENKSLAIVPDEAKVIRFIFEQYLSGVSMFEITRKVNQMGCLTHRGNVFEMRTVQYILNNPVYKGYMRWTPDKRMRRDFNNPSSIIRKGDWEPIISDEQWGEVAEKLRREKKRHYPKKRPETEGIHWLSSMIKCSNCGRSLAVATKYKNGEVQFQCGGYNHGQCQVSHSISTNRLVPAILSALDTIAADVESPNFVYTIRHEKPNTEELDSYVAMLEKANQRLRKAKEAYLNDIDTLEEYRSNKMRISKEIDELNDRISELRLNQTNPFDKKSFSAKIQSVLDVLRSDACTMEEKRTAVKSVLEKVIFCKKNDSLELFLIGE